MTQQHIITTHVGSLPRPKELLEANLQLARGEIAESDFNALLSQAVDDVVEKQYRLGINWIDDGEYGHITHGPVDFGSWWNYSFSRLSGLELSDNDRWNDQRTVVSTPGHIELTTFNDRRDHQRFKDAYEDPHGGIAFPSVKSPDITGKITYIGQDQTARDVRNLQTALQKRGLSQGFLPSLSPGSAARLKNRYYPDDQSLLNDVADAMHEEYKIITDAGLTVQLDAPDLAESWDQINPEPTLSDYKTWLQARIDAANRALQGIPRELVRLHICWGSWHAPHSTDIPFEEIIDQCLQINASVFSFEAASPRHAHEWRVWEHRPLKNGDRIAPGFVSHSTNVLEHPRHIADRIEQFASIVGPDRVIASTDCGLGGRIHPDIAWAKLDTLVKGARIASSELFSN